ncbi:MAG: zinc-binding dehydrogenase [Alphaproteobacteria bacterium]|nr:zinc-binding dehydrogenase [Alphaproteobacteria bacterium]
MKAILLTRTGDPSVLEYVDMSTPQPGPGEVLVKADTIGVSRPELLVRNGTYAWMPKLPAIPGIEMAGAVAELGAGAPGYAVGDKVYVSARELPQRAGCYAEYIAVPARALFRLDASANLEAAACLSNYQVAYHLLHTATRGAPGRSVLIDGAAGGLGSAAVQLAKIAGMTTIAIVGAPAKVPALQAFGADHVIDASREDVAERVKAVTDVEGVDLILDAAGGAKFASLLAMLAPFGLAVSYGKLVGPLEANLAAALDRGPGYLNSTAVRVFTMHTLDGRPDLRAESMRYLIARLADGAIRPLIHARLPLKDARRAHEMLEARQAIGKVLLKP